MKIKKIIYIIFFTFILNLNLALAKGIDLNGKFIPLKDFILLKFDLFLNNNLNNLTSGAGITHVAYQSIKYDVFPNSILLIEIEDIFLILLSL